MAGETVYDEQGNVIYSSSDTEDANAAPSMATLDGWRNKVVEFQNTLQALDVTYSQLVELGYTVYALNDSTAIAEYEELKNEFENKRAAFRAAASAIQVASDAMNAIGVHFPGIQMPIGLSALPAAGFAAVVAAVAAGAVLVSWSQNFFTSVREAIRRWQTLDAIKALPASEQAAALNKLQDSDRQIAVAQAKASESSFSAIASFGKWIVLGGIVYLGYRIYKDSKHGYR